MKRSRFWWSPILVVLIVLFGILLSPAHAATTASTSQVQSVQSLEDALFAVHYDQDSMETRLGRLEQTIFGQSQTGFSVDARLAKLQKVLSPNSLGPLSPTAKPLDNTSPADQTTQATGGKKQTGKPSVAMPMNPSNNNNKTTASAPPPPSTDATDYPTVTQMEQKVLGKTFIQEDITQRLARLEKQVFKNSQNGSLADRVDNLRLVVLGDVPTAVPPNIGYVPSSGGGQGYQSNAPPAFPTNQYGIPVAPGDYNPGQSNNYGGPPPSVAYSNGMNDPSGGGLGGSNMGSGAATPDMLAAIGEVEKEVLGQQFPSEPFTARLDRLETKIFHSTSPEMPLEDRMQRITAVASAGGAPESGKTKMKHTIQALLPIILTILPLVLL